MICRCGINERVDRYGQLLAAMEVGADLYCDGSPLQLSVVEMWRFVKELDGDVYLQASKRRLYILMRLDSVLSDGSASYDHNVLSIEHVLPQNPPDSSQWREWYPNPATREKWVHRLGNLVLLNRRKNSIASNYDFARKKQTYFARGGISPFPLTTQVLKYDDWTELVLRERQKFLLGQLMDIWRLPMDALEDPIEEDDGKDEGFEVSVGRSRFHGQIIPLLEEKFGAQLQKRSRILWASPDERVLVSCQVSKKFEDENIDYWFALKRATKETLELHPNSYCAFGLGSPEKVMVVPFMVIKSYLQQMHTSPEKDGRVLHWHVQFREEGGAFELILSGAKNTVDLTEYFVMRR